MVPLIKAPSTKPQYPGKFQPSTFKQWRERIGAWLLELPWNLVLGIWGFRHCFSSCSDQLPNVAKVLLGGEHVSETNPHHGATAQFGLVQISATRGVDSFNDLAVEDVDLGFVTSHKPETNDRQDYRRREFEAFVALDPIRERVSETHLIAQSIGHSNAAERTPDHPRFESAETAAELNAVIHVIFFSFNRVGPQVFRNEREDTTQPVEIAHIQNAEIERDEERLVRIDHNRIRVAPALDKPLIFRQNREPAAVSSIDVQPDFVFATNLCDVRNWIDTRGGCCANGRDGRERFEFFGDVAFEHCSQRRHIQAKFGIARDALNIFFA